MRRRKSNSDLQHDTRNEKIVPYLLFGKSPLVPLRPLMQNLALDLCSQLIQSKSIQLNSDQHIWLAGPTPGFFTTPLPHPLFVSSSTGTPICKEKYGLLCRLYSTRSTAMTLHAVANLRDRPFRCLTAQSPQPCSPESGTKTEHQFCPTMSCPKRQREKGRKEVARSTAHIVAIKLQQ